MACSIPQSELDWMERRENKRKYGMEVLNEALFKEVACQSCKFIESNSAMHNSPLLVQKWFAEHKKEDAAREAENETLRKGREEREREELRKLAKKYPMTAMESAKNSLGAKKTKSKK